MKKILSTGVFLSRTLQNSMRTALSCLVMIMTLLPVQAASAYQQDQQINLNLNQVPLQSVLKKIEDQTDYRFFYKVGDIDTSEKVSVSVQQKPLNEVLNNIFSGLPITYSFKGNQIVLTKKLASRPTQNTRGEFQEKTISGVVTDHKGVPLPGVTVLKRGSYKGLTTNFDGEYSIEAAEGDIIVFRYVGFVTQSFVVEDKTTVNIQMQPDVEELSEVVLTGYFERKKESFTGAETTISGEQVMSMSNQNVLQAVSLADPTFKLVENNNFGSNPNRLPDFQIRGSSSLNTSTDARDFQNNPNMPTFIMDGFEVNPQLVFDLDPNQVESVTILRDAAATAIYGSRASNGVVVITTKKPEPGKLRVRFSSNLDFAAADLSDYNLMNAEEKLEFEVLAGLYNHPNVAVNEQRQERYNEILSLVEQGNNTDWISIPVRDLAAADSHSATFEGGTQDFVYAATIFHKETAASMKGSSRERNGISVRLQHNKDKVRFANTMSYTQVNATESHFGDFSAYTYLNPYFYPYDEEGNIKQNLYVFENGQVEPNYLYNSTLNNIDENEYSVFLNNFSLSWDINQDLRLTSRLGLTATKSSADRFIPGENTMFNLTGIDGRYTKSGSNAMTYDGNVVLSYNKLFGGKHLLNATGIYNISESRNDSFSFIGENYPNSNLDHVSMGTEYETGGSPGGDYLLTRLMGVVGNLNYSYDNRFVADFSVRSDASSIFGANDRWGTFYSGGLGWNIHNEGFLENSSWVNLLKIRSSFGQTGGTQFNPYQSFMTYNYNNPALDGLSYNGDLGALLIAFGNPDLKWQRNDKFNLGFDFGFFNNRLSGRFNYYDEISKNQLINVTLAPSTGFPTYTENLGKVKNEGFELSVRYSVLKPESNKYQWDLFVNAIQNNNSLLEINDALTAFNERQDELAADQDNPVNSPVVKFQEGQSVNTIWAVESLGIDPATGNEVFVDRFGNPTFDYNFADQKPLAVTDPDLEGNFGTAFRYGGFELNAFFGFKFGGYLYNQTLVNKIENVDPRRNQDRRALTERWRNPGDVALYRRIPDVQDYLNGNPPITYPTSRFIQEDDELRLQSLNLAYNFGRGVTETLGVDFFKVTAIANDVFRINSADIERGISYPFARYYSLNLQVTF